MWLQLYSIMKQARLITKPGPALVSEALYITNVPSRVESIVFFGFILYEKLTS